MKKNKTSDKKLILGMMLIFSLTFLLVYLVRWNVTFADEDDIIYADELNVGDFLPYGATISNNMIYYESSGGYINDLYVYYIPDEDDAVNFRTDINYDAIFDDPVGICSNCRYNYVCGSSVFIENEFSSNTECKEKYGSSFRFNEGYLNSWVASYLNKYGARTYGDSSSFNILKYSDIFGDYSKEFVGWEVAQMSGSAISLKPVLTDVSKKPVDYEITGDCSDGSSPSYYWYKYQDIDNYLIDGVYSNTTVGTNWNISDDGVFFIEFDKWEGSYFSSTLTFDFESGDDKYFSYDFKYDCVTCSAFLDNTEVDAFSEVKNLFYNKKIYKIDTSGKHVFSFKVNSDIWGFNLFVKNPMLLTLLNEDAVLDTSLVQDGDALYYQAVCENGYVLSGTTVFDAPDVTEEEPEEEKTEDIEQVPENPNTFVGNVVIIFTIAFVSFVLWRKFKNKKQEMN